MGPSFFFEELLTVVEEEVNDECSFSTAARPCYHYPRGVGKMHAKPVDVGMSGIVRDAAIRRLARHVLFLLVFSSPVGVLSFAALSLTFCRDFLQALDELFHAGIIVCQRFSECAQNVARSFSFSSLSLK